MPFFFSKGFATMEPVSIDNLSILYQSEDFIVVNKHWDVRIDSKMWYEKLTLQSQLKYRFPELADPGTYYGFRFCHQLDFSTSGALCVALNREAAGSVYKCFKNRTVTKAYLALVRGHIQEAKKMICFAIGKNTTEGLTHMMCIEGTDGCESPKPCRSELIVLEYGLYSGEPATKVLLQPLTGRTHQLRVHCSAIGHPIVGDFTYSFKKDSAPYRMMLHAYYLCIPTSKELIEVSAPDPFVPSFDSSWVPQHLIHRLDELIQELKDKGIWAGEEEKQEDPSAVLSCEVTPEMKTQEIEEQQTHCKQWLSEWAPE
ncbi:RNA pseudouridylate synthase domain-containing protein 1 isoform X1 [Pseudonaja textilis]|uniref:RNA pseudouridine synthase domain containing 1 n=2 Tax=Pseudonaja textilis TaxID=8673 RepID=A0A670XQF3_PSETE|nr:RNA pseudouridylate synthase domain-containing protein 1 isoform X1 [Pseudonaja textilis]